MAPRKKPDPVPPKMTVDPNDDMAKLKAEIQQRAMDVINAQQKVSGTSAFGPSPLEEKWQAMQAQVKQLSADLASGDVEVRVLQVDPRTGRTTDVSDRVRPTDLKPEQIKAFDSSDGSVRIPRLPDGTVDREAAMDMLAQLVMGDRLGGKTRPDPKIQEMEALLKETDKILAHWRR
jgi:hypothetical protein